MIATISPSMLSAGENVSTMRFADRVRAIRNRAVAIEANDPNAVLEVTGSALCIAAVAVRPSVLAAKKG